MFQKIKEFHRRTMEEYNRDIEAAMEPWKKRVMKIHEDAQFLFYAEEIDDGKKRGECMIRGDLVRGKRQIGDELLFLNGEGEELATAFLGGEPEEKEQTRRGLIHHKRNEFQAILHTIAGENVESMTEQEYRRRFLSLGMNLSLITEAEILIEE